jgi:hypothetical protein
LQNLTNAKLTGAILILTKYDQDTKWPDGFDPEAIGAKEINP